MSTGTTTPRFWLRKKGTLQVYPRTALLAKRDDMEPISDEDATRLIASLDSSNKQRAQARAQARMMGDAPPVMLGSNANEAPVSEDRQRLEEQVKAGIVPQSALSDPSQPAAPKTLEQMSRAELIEVAAEMKVRIADNWGDAAVRKHIQDAIDAEKSEAAGGGRPEDERDGEAKA